MTKCKSREDIAAEVIAKLAGNPDVAYLRHIGENVKMGVA